MPPHPPPPRTRVPAPLHAHAPLSTRLLEISLPLTGLTVSKRSIFGPFGLLVLLEGLYSPIKSQIKKIAGAGASQPPPPNPQSNGHFEPNPQSNGHFDQNCRFPLFVPFSPPLISGLLFGF
jgi:hypothetical protein